MRIPYSTSTAGDRALMELQRALGKFGCQSFGSGMDAERGVTMVWFRWRDRDVRLEANWNGYAQALLKGRKSHWNAQKNRAAEAAALEQAKVSVCSCLRDWVKGQITAVEFGVMSFETAFMPHMLLKNGTRVIDAAASAGLLEAPKDG